MNDYNILNINKNASQYEIRKAYIKLAKKYHPDKTKINNNNEFIKINKAYNNLKNNNNNNNFNKILFYKIFQILINNIIKFNENKDKIIIINYSLEEIYNNSIKTIIYKRLNKENILENINIKINLNSNNYNNQILIFKQYGNIKVNKIDYSDLIIILKEKKHELYKRNNFDLIIDINLSLKEALLCNTKLKIPLLDDTYIIYNIHKVIYPDYFKIIKNKGLKIKNNLYGNLILKFKIIFPKTINKDNINIIKNLEI